MSRAAAGGSGAGDEIPAGSTSHRGAELGVGGLGGPAGEGCTAASSLRAIPTRPPTSPLLSYTRCCFCSQIRHLEGGAGCVRVPALHRAFPLAPRGGSTHPFAHLLPGCPCPGGGALTCGVWVLTLMLGWVPASLTGYPRCAEPPKASLGQERVAMLSPGRMGLH